MRSCKSIRCSSRSTALNVQKASDILINTNLDDETINKAAKACEEACNLIDDKRGTVAYRKKFLLFKRAANCS